MRPRSILAPGRWLCSVTILLGTTFCADEECHPGDFFCSQSAALLSYLLIAPLGLSGGASHTCGVSSYGGVRCWGDATDGRLGYGNLNAFGDNESAGSGGDVLPGLLTFQVAAAGAHSCALLSGGRVRCWGSGADGRLGLGNITSIGDDELAASGGELVLSAPAVQIACGNFHSCAILSGGGVQCWGRNDVGQLGYGNTNSIGDTENPASAGLVDVGGPVRQLALGDASSCALLENGAVRCWGSGAGGKLGYGNISDVGDNETPASAGDVNLGEPALQISNGGTHVCALLQSRRVICWGGSAFGQLGYGNTLVIGDTESPVSAGYVDVGGLVNQVIAQGIHTCALLNGGSVRCWGQNAAGRLGSPLAVAPVGDGEAASSAPLVDLGAPALLLADGGSDHTCALLATGVTRCWGNGLNGRLGYGNVNVVGDDETPLQAGAVLWR